MDNIQTLDQLDNMHWDGPRQLWLAGLGLCSWIGKTSQEMFNDLVEAGKSYEYKRSLATQLPPASAVAPKLVSSASLGVSSGSLPPSLIALHDLRKKLDKMQRQLEVLQQRFGA